MNSYGAEHKRGRGSGAGATSSTAPLPGRRRNLQGPLHPSNRPAPSASSSSLSSTPAASGFVPALSSPLRASDSPDMPQPSVFLSNNALPRKRSHFSTSAYIPSTPPPPSAQHQYGTYTAASLQHSSPVDVPDLDCDASWLSSSSHYHQQQGSPSTNRYGTWSRKPGFQSALLIAEPQSSTPVRPPQGEFSFHAKTTSGPALREMPSSMYAQHLEVQDGETSSSAFARLAQAQRQQQESRRLAASGASKAEEDHVDGPATKKRKGMTSTIVSGALNAALYTGAAALTAYSMWSSWGRKADDEDEDEVRQPPGPRQLSREKLPPGALVDEPPPPYMEQSMSNGGVRAKSGPSTASPATQSQRPLHVFVSSRRRRPVFASHRSSRGTPKRGNSTAVLPATPTTTMNADTDDSFVSGSAMGNNGGDDDNDDDDDDDEMFRRFQAKMSSLIEEGTRALNSKADLGAMDLGDDDNDDRRSQSFSHARTSSAAAQLAPVDPLIAASVSATGGRLAPFSQSQSAWTLGVDADRRPYDDNNDSTGSVVRSGPAAALVSPTRTPFLSLASRDPNSPYGRLTRPSPGESSPLSRRRF